MYEYIFTQTTFNVSKILVYDIYFNWFIYKYALMFKITYEIQLNATYEHRNTLSRLIFSEYKRQK